MEPLAGSDNLYIDSLYESYSSNPDSVDDSWQKFFEGFEFALKSGAGADTSSPKGIGDFSEKELRAEFNVFRMIQGYRSRGHMIAKTNPIQQRADRKSYLGIEAYDLSEADLDKRFLVGEFVGLGRATLREIVQFLKDIYTRSIGIEYTHINNTDIRRWIRKKLEEGSRHINPSNAKQKRTLKKLDEATAFENFLQTKYTGQKRFSLEGGETTIPALDAMIQKTGEVGGEEVVIGMAHRGRLNVLTNIVGKSYAYVFNEFEGGVIKYDDDSGSGDVKYHKGYTTVVTSESGQEVIVKLMANPSHLEAVGPVTQGYVRAQIDMSYKGRHKKCVPIVLHGDAALAGQGICYEMLQMAKLQSYSTGGTIHFVINNQIGFTTDWKEGRSSSYCTSLAKMIDAPIVHVNGDDPDAVVYASEFAVEFRKEFGEDIFIDMVCYRKYGHNEGDEPKFTQPHLYELIGKHENPREIYVKKLLAQGDITQGEADKMNKDFKDRLSDLFNNMKDKNLPKPKKGPHQDWKGMDWSKEGDFDFSPETGVAKDKLQKIVDAISSVPADFNPLRKAKRIIEKRAKRFADNVIDWELGESLAYGSILLEGSHIRFTGQDVIRGTFSHRHAKVFDEKTSLSYCGLNNLSDDQGSLEIYNSILSEYAVLGYEYGYSLAHPKGLTIWEAQFGDFSNGAQIILDQFISSAEMKWKRMSGIILLLPHGFEGQGPEHSSARPERFLQLAANDNMVVVNCSTPANFFHALRRQLAWPFRKPMIHFSPKSLLRHPKCISTVEELENGKFQEVIDDHAVDAKDVTRVLVCWGKVYYDLLQKREELGREKDVAIVRLEQLYPLPEKQIDVIEKKYENADFFWVQEEPKNMGAWTYLLRYRNFRRYTRVSRKPSASPATGFPSTHIKEQNEIMNKAFHKEHTKYERK
ncbi:MAG: 2-oxoglutarate dehydrogenase E1 component [Bacteriovoracaceae bacterium]